MNFDFQHLHNRFIDAARRDDVLDAQYLLRLTAMNLLDAIQTCFQRHPSIEALGTFIPAFNFKGSPIRLAFWGEGEAASQAAQVFQAWVDQELCSIHQQWSIPQLRIIAQCVFDYGSDAEGGYTKITRDNLHEGILRTIGDEVGREVQAMVDAERLSASSVEAEGVATASRL